MCERVHACVRALCVCMCVSCMRVCVDAACIYVCVCVPPCVEGGGGFNLRHKVSNDAYRKLLGSSPPVYCDIVLSCLLKKKKKTPVKFS